jgi:alpha-tubulin suppressor-like RCC1 family protein
VVLGRVEHLRSDAGCRTLNGVTTCNVGPNMYDRPRRTTGDGGYRSIATGAWQGCAVVAATGEGHCWGHNVYGALGTGDLVDHSAPTPVRMPPGVQLVDIQHGSFSACGRSTDGKIYCWGSNRYGALGQGTKDELDHPFPVGVNVPPAASLSVQNFAACVITTGGERWCWGNNSASAAGNGRLGDGTNDPEILCPRRVP